ncbi:hypothetical protein [Oxalicibacterium faecigallinarum]|uniref:Uncharacterized protein n=1 Tax=Oxalicibacterium faecigallinarum TaxID=573741 RepID=A0A8J3F297_9BURK|nr:hypothetical protein [Oxalicibacterium faecigallinarum]GGI20862.1 hypothetical protein GCM10008066_26150 [Oxalicibacterium faecigallinarum]
MQGFGRDPVNEAQWRALDAIGTSWSPPQPSDWLLAIDDTDNLDSRGTGFLARQLGLRLAEAGLAEVKAITRHQLLVDPRIPYTSHNSSACLVLQSIVDRKTIFDYTCRYLLDESAEGSDAGTVLVQRADLPEDVQAFGYAAKQQVLEQADAWKLVEQRPMDMAGLTGTHGGVIGALAAVGLNASGRDGRFLWLKQLRSLSGKQWTVGALEQATGVTVQSTQGPDISITADDHIDLGEWPRAIFLHGQATLLVENINETNFNGWRSASKDYIRQF